MLDAVDGTVIISEMSTRKEDLKLSCALTRTKVVLTFILEGSFAGGDNSNHPQARLTYDP
jgi:hypothetical protein